MTETPLEDEMGETAESSAESSEAPGKAPIDHPSEGEAKGETPPAEAASEPPTAGSEDAINRGEEGAEKPEGDKPKEGDLEKSEGDKLAEGQPDKPPKDEAAGGEGKAAAPTATSVEARETTETTDAAAVDLAGDASGRMRGIAEAPTPELRGDHSEGGEPPESGMPEAPDESEGGWTMESTPADESEGGEAAPSEPASDESEVDASEGGDSGEGDAPRPDSPASLTVEGPEGPAYMIGSSRQNIDRLREAIDATISEWQQGDLSESSEGGTGEVSEPSELSPDESEGGEAAPSDPRMASIGESSPGIDKVTTVEKADALYPSTPEERALVEGEETGETPTEPGSWMEDTVAGSLADIAQSMFTRPARMMWEFAESIVDDIQEIASELSTLSEGEEETGDTREDERD